MTPAVDGTKCAKMAVLVFPHTHFKLNNSTVRCVGLLFYTRTKVKAKIREQRRKPEPVSKLAILQNEPVMFHTDR